MDTVKLIIGAACFTGLAISVAEMLKPSETFNKQIKLIFALVFIISIFSPVAAGGIDFSFSGSEIEANGGYNAVDEVVDEGLKGTIEENIATELKIKLLETGIKCGSIKVNINMDENSSISINKVEIDTDDNEKARNMLMSLLSLEEDKVTIIGN